MPKPVSGDIKRSNEVTVMSNPLEVKVSPKYARADVPRVDRLEIVRPTDPLALRRFEQRLLLLGIAPATHPDEIVTELKRDDPRALEGFGRALGFDYYVDWGFDGYAAIAASSGRPDAIDERDLERLAWAQAKLGWQTATTTYQYKTYENCRQTFSSGKWVDACTDADLGDEVQLASESVSVFSVVTGASEVVANAYLKNCTALANKANHATEESLLNRDVTRLKQLDADLKTLAAALGDDGVAVNRALTLADAASADGFIREMSALRATLSKGVIFKGMRRTFDWSMEYSVAESIASITRQTGEELYLSWRDTTQSWLELRVGPRSKAIDEATKK